MARTYDERGAMARVPVHQAYRTLRFAFTVAPIILGLDKFFNVLVNWNHYLAPSVSQMLPVSPGMFMRDVGVVEIAAGLVVAFNPVIGGWLVAVWLWAIIVNLLLIPGYYDIAVRDFGLSLGAVALARLASAFAVRAERGAFPEEHRPAA